MSVHKINEDKIRVVPALISFIARHISRRIGSMLISLISSEVRNFVTIVHNQGVYMKVWTGEAIGRKMYYFHDFEYKQTQVFLSLVNESTIFYDIGANMGYYSLLTAVHGGRAFAFEPSPEILQWLNVNIELNRNLKPITVVPEAVSDHDGTVTFFPHREGNFGVGKIFADKTIATENSVVAPSITVQSKTLDSVVEKYGAPNLIKMDIEGAEYFVLKNPPELLRRTDAPVLLIEFHEIAIKELGGSIEVLREGLLKIGYRCYKICGIHKETKEQTWEIFSKKSIESEHLEEVVCEEKI